LRNLFFADRDEWRRFRVHGDTVLALEAVTAERDRLQAQLDECESFKSPSNPLLRAALEEGNDDE
jgi:hypothetical protein